MGSGSASSSGHEQFVHLHVHTEYSMLDGAARLTELFAETARMGMPALAMTDHGNVFGAYDFYSKANAAGVKPIIGMEAYLTPNTTALRAHPGALGEGGDDDVSGGGAFTHMTLLAENTAGMHNLFRLSSRSSLEGFFYKPRADRELLAQYAGGLIATTGCPSGEIQTWLRIGDYDKARASAAEFRDIFGARQLLPRADGPRPRHRDPRPRRTCCGSPATSQLPMIATNDLHYTHAADADTHEILLCVQSGKTMADPNRFKFDARDFYLKSPAEMRSLWADKYDLREACDNTLLIAERCDGQLHRGQRHLHAALPGARGRDRDARWFVKEVERGLRAPLPGRHPGRRRASRPTTRSASSTRWASPATSSSSPTSSTGPRTTASGSARAAVPARARSSPTRCASPTSTRCEHGLIFERFLNPDRVSMPDFDVDFDERRRGEVIRYVSDKYGDDRVAQIVTYGTIKAKQAVKDAAARARLPVRDGRPHHQGHAAAGHGQGRPARQDLRHHATSATTRAASSARSTRPTPRSRRSSTRPRASRGSSGSGACTRPASSCPREPLIDLIPIMKREQDGAIITQFDYPTCEKLGLIKMDFLGLRNLTVLDDALRNIKANRGETIVLEDLDARRPAHLRAARPRRHPRGLPARRRADARAAALDAPGQLRGHLRRRRALPARARWARTRTTSTPTARTAASRSCRSTPSSPSRWRRSSARPTA